MAGRIFTCSMGTLGCSILDLVPDQGLNPGPLYWEHGVLDHWTTREVPEFLI